MDFIRGAVVCSKAGRDKGNFLTVLEAGKGFAVVCDGRRRSLGHPKRKNVLHLSLTTAVLDEASMETDRAIRKALRSFAERSAEDTVLLEEGYKCQNRT